MRSKGANLAGRVRVGGLLRRSAVFTIGIYVPRLITVITLPIYIRLLSPSDFASLALFEMLLGLFAIVTNAGFSSALLRHHSDQDSEAGRNTAFITAFLASLGFGLAIVAITFFLGPHLARMMNWHASDTDLIIRIIAAIAAFDAVNAISSTFLRVRNDAVGFAGLAIARAVIGNATAAYLIIVDGLGVVGFFAGSLLGSATCLLVSGMWLLSRHWSRPRFLLALDLLRFSGPYIPLGFLELLAGRVGFICLLAVGGAEVIAVYAVAEKVSSLVILAYAPIGTMLTPFMFRIANDREAPAIFAKITTLLAAFVGLILIFVSGLAEEIVSILAGRSYVASTSIVLPLALAASLSAIRPCVRIGVAIAKKTYLLPILTGAAAAIGLAATQLLTLYFGIQGAAWGTALTALVILFLSGYTSQLYVPVPLEWRYISTVIVIATAAIVTLHFWIGPSLVWKSAMLLSSICFALLLIRMTLNSAPLQALR